MLDRIKIALRISHNLLDGEIYELIDVARHELIRAGVSSDKANALDDPLINQAIKTYCLSELYDDNEERERQKTSWLYQLDNLRKSVGYV